MKRRGRTRAILVLGVLSLLAHRGAAGEELQRVELVPADRAGWTPGKLLAPITGLFRGGPGYWYDERRVEVRTTPPGASLDLFYVRGSVQEGFEQADAPASVILPRRIDTHPRDSLRVRASLDGYRQKEVRIDVRSREERVEIELEPLANSLAAVTHRYLAGRTSLGLVTSEALTFRMQRMGADHALILVETVLTPTARQSMEGVRDPLLAALRPQQLGQDLVIRLVLAVEEDDVEIRQRQAYDPVRRRHLFALDIAPADGAGVSVRRAREALARIAPERVSGCALEFDRALRAGLEPSALARALSARGEFTDPYLRAAMRRLGELSPDGAVHLVDGNAYHTASPLELSAAESQAAEVEGFLVMLRELVAELEAQPHRRETLRGLVAPERSPGDFADVVGVAEAAEQRCLGSEA